MLNDVNGQNERERKKKEQVGEGGGGYSECNMEEKSEKGGEAERKEQGESRSGVGGLARSWWEGGGGINM